MRKKAPLVETPIMKVYKGHACGVCWPDKPEKIKTYHEVCEKVCGHTKPVPCPHNGGVKVRVARSTGQLDMYVWPENAWRHTILTSSS